MLHWPVVLLSSGVLLGVRALPQGPVTSSVTAPSITVSTVVASPSVPLSSSIPSQVPLPPTQAWCPSKIFCAGELLQTVNIAALYADPKTFVDKPTSKSSQEVLSAFQAITNDTEGNIVDFVDDNFRGEGLELEAVALSSFNADPAFLNNVSDPLVKAFSQTVHGFWTQLIRQTNQSTLCPEGTESGSCESSLIPLNHTFVVPGGRFREQYYWDSYWIVQGLIKSQLYDIVKDTLENFMDELENFGFIPNGGRIYYLNRSQPPLFIHMLSDYVAASNDTSVLDRGLPLAEAELKWWAQNRSLNVTSPFTNKTYTMARYAVNNTAPRPESYLTDYLTANDPALSTPLTEDQRSNLYAELASGAETGWDYSSRWLKDPLAGSASDQNPKLRSLNVRGTLPICLNSILYKAHLLLADLYETKQTNSSSVSTHRATAEAIRAGILDLFWDPSKLAFYDFNLTSNARSTVFNVATFYPLWNGIVPDELLSSSQNAFGFFSSLNMVLNRYNGTYPVTFLETGLQWDAPNSWPPHQYIALEALRALPSNVSSGALPTPSSDQSTFSLIPDGQLLVSEDALPKQSLIGNNNASTSGSSADINKLDGTVFNGGNKTDGEGWAATLQRELANRYIASALCSWHATGGEIPNVLPRLSTQELNVTQSVNNTGNMFEKFSISDVDSAGRGGEYTVQAGFGWTNGVVLWVASTYGNVLVAPQCPDLLAQATSTTTATGGSNAASSVRAAPAITIALAFVAAIIMA
ncbi:glycoside hydrolase family 37 protein [Lentinus tigrinus ALCF2SS1-7]|uniref:Trehalase n=1 Tax=Lentinus tigrinus ALCF2SS1-6 TaxID=1328759 RepID=A0A5C2RYD7_9APHY|nr:glycoside hydrolase family 37 protein [Lentinus tigrinus ALCF2SS1-6]RPD74057.1 glycoside hydrolase family 37 protein [Lentinus tigrinus ALCF2SS1-7]